MSEVKDFTIDKVAWSTKREGTIQTVDSVVHEFWCLVDFLQKEKLTTRVLANTKKEITEEFSIKRSDLNDLGFLLIQKAHEKWLNGLDKGKSPEDLKVFEKELKKLRGN